MLISGFCDSILSAEEVLEAIKMTVRTNLIHIDKVVLVCAGKIEQKQLQGMKQLLGWLNYHKYKENFVLLYNKADQCQNDEEKWLSLEYMCTQFGVPVMHALRKRLADGSLQSIKMTMAIAFPPKVDFENVREDYEMFAEAVTIPHQNMQRIPVNKSTCTIL